MAERKPNKPRLRGNGEGSAYQRKDGRWVAAITVDGKRVAIYGKTRAEAVTALRNLIAARENGALQSITNRTTVAEFAAIWLETVRPNVRATTYLRYEQYVRIQIVPHVGAKRLNVVSPAEISAMIEQLRAGGLSPTTLHHLHAALHKLLQQAVDWGILQRNPAERVKTPRKATPKRVPLAPDELAKLFAAARSHRLEGIVILAAMNGLREGELAGLRWEDVELDAGVLMIQQQMARAETGYAPSETKSSGSRRVGRLSRVAADALRRRQVAQKEERLRAGASWVETGLVFTRPNGMRVTQNHLVRDVLAPLLAKAGLPSVTLHDLRHSFATVGLRRGIPLKIMSEALGHASIALTADLYSHVSADMQQPIADGFDALFGQS